MKCTVRLPLLLVIVLLFPAYLTAQDKKSEQTLSQRHTIPEGSRIYISPMEGKLEGFIAAELVKKKLPIIVVIDDKQADYIIAGASIKGDDKWFHSIFGTGKDKNEGNIQVISVKDKTVIWAGEAGDRSLWWGDVRRGGQRRVADRLIDKMKKDLFRT
ncbi:MAG: hypothetical protein ACREBG_05245 [Pyrinomonadaceae bacterium]